MMGQYIPIFDRDGNQTGVAYETFNSEQLKIIQQMIEEHVEKTLRGIIRSPFPAINETFEALAKALKEGPQS